MASREDIQLVRTFYNELFVEHNLAVIDDLVSDEYKAHQDRGPGRGEATGNAQSFKDTVRMFYSAFPDQKTTIESISEDGDMVAAQWTTRGTHLARFMGLAPTSRQITIRGSCKIRIADGKIVESWTNWDLGDLMKQLAA